MCSFQGTHQRGASTLRRIGHLDTTGGDLPTYRVRQGKEGEYTFSLPQPWVSGSHLPQSWTGVIGVTGAEIRVGSDEQVFVASVPGPIETTYLAHVALAVETGGARLSDESSPLVEPYRDALYIPNAERLQAFPYLQFAPPHCCTCRC